MLSKPIEYNFPLVDVPIPPAPYSIATVKVTVHVSGQVGIRGPAHGSPAISASAPVPSSPPAAATCSDAFEPFATAKANAVAELDIGPDGIDLVDGGVGADVVLFDLSLPSTSSVTLSQAKTDLRDAVGVTATASFLSGRFYWFVDVPDIGECFSTAGKTCSDHIEGDIYSFPPAIYKSETLASWNRDNLIVTE
jgi:hypothetical protein